MKSPSSKVAVKTKLFPLVSVKLNVKVCHSAVKDISLLTPSFAMPNEAVISRLARI